MLSFLLLVSLLIPDRCSASILASTGGYAGSSAPSSLWYPPPRLSLSSPFPDNLRDDCIPGLFQADGSHEPHLPMVERRSRLDPAYAVRLECSNRRHNHLRLRQGHIPPGETVLLLPGRMLSF